MHTRLSLFLRFLLGLSCSSAWAADSYLVTGTLRARLSAYEVVIEHDDIPGLMPAMTMAFLLDRPLPEGSLIPGDSVRGRLEMGGSGMLLHDLQRKGSIAPTEPAKNASRVVRLNEGDAVPAFELVNENGQPQPVASPGQFTALTFIFTRCPIPDFCPLMSSRFAELQRQRLTEHAGLPLKLLSITIDPEFDQPDVLAQYASAYGADPDIWNFGVASIEETDRIVRSFRVFRELNGALLDHTLATALIGPDGKIIRIWRGNEWSPEELIGAAHNAQVQN